MSIVILGSTSGSITLQEPAVAGSTVLSLPATTGTVLTSASPSSDLPSSINGPAFNAYMVNGNANQSITSGVATKVKIDTVEFDTNTNFDTSLYRFTPTVAGYYNIIGQVYCSGTSITAASARIYKNGAEVTRSQSAAGVVALNTSSIIYLNGSTDYVELYGSVSATSPVFGYSNELCRFSGCLVRSA